MKKITQKAVVTFLCLSALLINFSSKAQTPYISLTNPTCWSNNNTSLGVNAGVVPMIPGATSYSWSVVMTNTWTSACMPSQTSLSSNNDSTYFDFTCSGVYTIICTGYNASNTLLGTLTSTYSVGSPPPSVFITSSNVNTVNVCPGVAVTLTANGASTYTWSNGSCGASVVLLGYTSSTTMSLIGTSASGCTSSATYNQMVYNWPYINIAGPTNGTVCQGSSAILTASGANSYTWFPMNVNSATLSIVPMFFCNQYTVSGTDANNCVGTMTTYICVDTACANVWPGDANSDGLVDNTDVFEIGLAFGQTGTARSSGGNSFTSQYASSLGWTGFGSTGKRKVHVDCNGDGTIDLGDTVAIYNNYSLTHTFKPTETSNNADLSLVTTNVMEGMWNKADIILGSTSTPINQLYGVAFDINFDNSLMETNSAYITYSSSFLNASTTNVQFRKTQFANGKVYAASVRTNGTDVNGNGKIGEFWFKVKTGSVGSTLNLSTSNSQRMGKNGIKSVLSGGAVSPVINAKTVGLNTFDLNTSVSYFPNPASNELKLSTGLTTELNYAIIDILGRDVKNGTFNTTTTLDVSTLQNGSYLIRLSAGSEVVYKKLVLDK